MRSSDLRQRRAADLRAACGVVESLESRRLLAGDYTTVQPLPFVLEWSNPNVGAPDRNGVGTGFPMVWDNTPRNEYQPAQLEVDTAASVLRVTSTGSSAAGGNYNSDNTLTNALGTNFNAAGMGFQATVKLRGPLSQIDRPADQGGLLFGPDQDNYVKLVVAAQADGPVVQFVDEQVIGGRIVHTIPSKSQTVRLGDLSNVQSLSLRIKGDPISGKVQGYYQINGASYVAMPAAVTLGGDRKAAFFNATSHGGIMTMHKNDVGPVTIAYDRFEIVAVAPEATRPTVTATRPSTKASGVARDAFIAVDVKIPNVGHGVDPSTLTFQTVKLYRTVDQQFVSANRNTSGGGDAIVLQPRGLLDANTSYTFEITDGLKDTAGAPFVPFRMTFTTGSSSQSIDPNIAFEKVTQPVATGQNFTALAFGPDGKLYAATFDGHIIRYNVAADGGLSAPQVIDTVINANGGARTITGLAFEPGSSASSLVLWVSHGQYAAEGQTADDWTGKITRLSGPNLEGCTDYVKNLPRSVRDHMTNQLSFGPDGAIYFVQASETGLGASDNAWGQRHEHLLSAAVLRLDYNKIPPNPTLDAKTEDGGTYDPFAPGAPLTIYASGIRNGYDIVWHSNGQLYVPANGGAAGGATPAYPSSTPSRRIDKGGTSYSGPNVPAIANVPETQDDLLFRVAKGGYYGHPNPSRGEYVLNGGNPSGGKDSFEVKAYPVGTQPDKNWRKPAYDFGKSYSPDGAIEYHGNAFGGRLKGKLLVTRYSGGDDVVALTVNADGSIGGLESGIAGLSLFTDPVDIVEHPNADAGYLYVAEYGGKAITLLRPVAPGAKLQLDAPSEMLFNDAPGGGAGASHTVRLTNTGTSPLILQADALSIVGTNATEFLITKRPSLPSTLAPGQGVDVAVAMAASSGSPGATKTATLRVKTNDPTKPRIDIPLRGLVTAGTGGANEPSLQRIFDFYKIPIKTGDSNPADVYLDNPPRSPNDEVAIPRFVKAGTGPVTIEPIATFGVSSSPAVRFGYYDPGSPQRKTELFTIEKSDAQTLQPTPNGVTEFDPQGAFSLYTIWPGFSGREVFGEDAFNTWEPVAANRHKLRVYPLKASSGSVVPNAYVIAFEEFTAGYDNQDFVAIVRNVAPAAAASAPSVGVENLDGSPYAGRLVFNKVQNPDNSAAGKPNNVFKDTAVLRIHNTGGSTLQLSQFQINEPFRLGGSATSASVAPGSRLDVVIHYAATSGRIHMGQLTFSTNDPAEPFVLVQLAGYWQSVNENNQEPSLQETLQVLGYDTDVVFSGQKLNGGGLRQAVGEEILSDYWSRVDGGLPVGVRQLSAWHTQGNVATFRWYAKGSSTTTTLFTATGAEGQSFLPHTADGGAAGGAFNPTGSFGFKIDGEWSDDSKNKQENTGGNYGHHVRFYRARDLWGEPIANAYLMTMDYQGINYDYNDNVYLVTNVRPEGRPSSPREAAAYGAADGNHIDWADNTDAGLGGYHVYRLNGPDGPVVERLTQSPVAASEFLDTTAPAGVTSYYRITATYKNGGESTPAAAHALRPAAAVKKAVTAGVARNAFVVPPTDDAIFSPKVKRPSLLESLDDMD